jgi:hypothetical protein
MRDFETEGRGGTRVSLDREEFHLVDEDFE